MKDLSEKDANSYLSFRIGTELYASSVANVISILEMTKITRVPQAPDYMKGVLNLRGSVLPILDLRVKFGLEDTEYTSDTCILVLEVVFKNEAFRMGAIVDSVQEVLNLGTEDIQPPPNIGSDFQSEFIIGMARNSDEFIMILDINKIFSAESIIDLNSLSGNE